MKTTTKHNRGRRLLLGLAIGMASPFALAQSNGFQLDFLLRRSGLDPWSFVVEVPFGEPFQGQTALRKVSGPVAAATPLVDPRNYTMSFKIAPEGQPLENFTSTRWQYKCLESTPQLFEVGESVLAEFDIVDRYSEEGEDVYIVPSPGRYTLQAVYQDEDTGTTVESLPVTLVVGTAPSWWPGLERQAVLRHFTGRVGGTNLDRRALDRQLALSPRSGWTTLFRRRDELARQSAPVVNVPNDLARALQRFMDAYLGGNVQALASAMTPGVSYNSALNQADIVALLPALRAKLGRAPSWTLRGYDAEQSAVLVDVVANGQLADSWKFTFVKEQGAWRVSSWDRQLR